jgi:hypothetical protein
VALLIDNGADPLIKDNSGKVAREYVKGNNPQLGWYLDKKGRIPAGK